MPYESCKNEDGTLKTTIEELKSISDNIEWCGCYYGSDNVFMKNENG